MREPGLVVNAILLAALCTFFTFNVVTGDTVVLLTKDYTDTSWTWLTRYTLSSGAGWRRDSSSQEYSTCDIQQTLTNSTDSWLISNFISVHPARAATIRTAFTVRQCPANLPYCQHHIKVFIFQSHEAIRSGVTQEAIEAGNFTFIGDATAGKLWSSGQPRVVNNVNITFPVSSKGVYIGFQDNGACVAMRKVQVTYQFCGRTVIGGAVFNATAAPLPGSIVQVQGECQGNFESMTNSSAQKPTIQCLSDGSWNASERAMCQCKAGYQLVLQACTACPAGTFKAKSGNTGCLPCAENTVTSDARTTCVCNPGHYRAPRDDINGRCTGPPSSPREAIAITIQPDVILLSWKPPLNNGGRNDVAYTITCRRCYHGNASLCTQPCGTIEYSPTANHSAYTHVTISHLSPGSRYVFRISALNGVSQVAGDSSVRSTEAVVSGPASEVPRVQISLISKNMAVFSWPARRKGDSALAYVESVVCNRCDTSNADCVTATCESPCGNAIYVWPKANELINSTSVIVTGLKSVTRYMFTFHVTRPPEYGSRGSNATSICVTTRAHAIGGDTAETGGSDVTRKEITTHYSTIALGVSGGLLVCAIVMFMLTIHLRRRWYKAAVHGNTSNNTSYPQTHRQEVGQYENVLYMEETFFRTKRAIGNKNNIERRN